MKSKIFVLALFLSANSVFADCPKVASINGIKWYLGADNQSCATTCVEHGGYNSAATRAAGIEGSLDTCRTVMTQLCDAFTLYRVGDVNCGPEANYGMSNGAGCFTYLSNLDPSPGGWSFRCNTGVGTSADALPGPGMARACACNE